MQRQGGDCDLDLELVGHVEEQDDTDLSPAPSQPMPAQIGWDPSTPDSSHPHHHPKHQAWHFRLLTVMASWVSEKPELIRRKDYDPLPGSLEDTEGQGRTANCCQHAPQAEPRRRRSWRLCAIVCGLALPALLLIMNIGPPVLRNLRGICGRNDGAGEDPFVNWGKPGTGTEDLAWYPTDFLRDVVPIPCHSHNDYWRKVPLFSAINVGCTGVEADVWLREGGQLLVGHDTAALQRNRTFESLYINPLVEILERQNPKTEYYNASRRGIFDTDPSQTLSLLVDLKTNGAETWPWVMKQLAPLRERGWLSYYEDGQVHLGPITVVGTGNTPFDQIVANSTYRDAFFDAPLDKLEGSNFDSTNSWYASVSFWSSIGNVFFRGKPSDAQLGKIRKQLEEAHKRGLYARYWELPPWPIHVRNRIWEILVEEGIDILNVDDLEAAAKGDWTKPRSFFGRIF
ncbi:hypothetical protein B0H63DRAFT_479621 [Podospora didyma]|uniref:Altered inheritance of mitochondria protein 6 n=1 Tax=Podospora didyma TaxID=330526 RepID=A0AAE0KKK3_9PEZI|nr:hypothetical protein B0H63DRAFT_479621 [Podospora didyma]